MDVAGSVLELIGNTPVLQLKRLSKENDAALFVKMENFNPGGSIKDRPGLYMIEKAEAEGKLKQGSVIVEATSGNTGIGLAMAAAIKAYHLIIVMPENMSEERKKILRIYGAELLLTPAEKGMAGAVEEARKLVASDQKYYMVEQFDNPANAESHSLSTAVEIVEQMDGKIDVFVAGIGSGGTITGVARVLKEKIPGIKIVGVEPASSAVLSGNPAGPHKIQGIGAGFIPGVLDRKLIDEIYTVSNDDAIETARELARKEALLLGISSGAAVFAGLQLASKLGKDKNILAIVPDGADKYMSTELFDF